MLALGGLMGIRTGLSLLVGAVLNYAILAPWMIARGDIHPLWKDGVPQYGFKAITVWGLWWGVAMMTTASLFSFFAKPQIIVGTFRSLLGRKAARGDGPNSRPTRIGLPASVERSDPLAGIELPMWVFVAGIPVVASLVVWLAHRFFDVAVWEGVLAIPLIFVFALIAVNSTALTSVTPLGAVGKLTQLTFGAIAPGNIKTNLATAAITAEVASHASNLLMDIKPGYMLGAKPRQQAVGHVLGIVAGALFSVPVFYLVFLHNGPQQLISEQYPMPAATVWKSVAELLTRGLGNLEVSARWAALAGALAGLALEAVRLLTKDRSWLSGVGIGLAAIMPFDNCLAMFLGGAALLARRAAMERLRRPYRPHRGAKPGAHLRRPDRRRGPNGHRRGRPRNLRPVMQCIRHTPCAADNVAPHTPCAAELTRTYDAQHPAGRAAAGGSCPRGPFSKSSSMHCTSVTASSTPSISDAALESRHSGCRSTRAWQACVTLHSGRRTSRDRTCTSNCVPCTSRSCSRACRVLASSSCSCRANRSLCSSALQIKTARCASLQGLLRKCDTPPSLMARARVSVSA